MIIDLGVICITLFYIIQFVIAPLCLIITSIYAFATKVKLSRTSGSKLADIEKAGKSGWRFFLYFWLLLLIFLSGVIIYYQKWSFLLYLMIPLSFVIQSKISDKLHKFQGIYAEGIFLNTTLIKWEEIAFWKQNNNVFIFLHDKGYGFSIKVIHNIKTVEQIIREKDIQKREDIY